MQQEFYHDHSYYTVWDTIRHGDNAAGIQLFSPQIDSPDLMVGRGISCLRCLTGLSYTGSYVSKYKVLIACEEGYK